MTETDAAIGIALMTAVWVAGVVLAHVCAAVMQRRDKRRRGREGDALSVRARELSDRGWET